MAGGYKGLTGKEGKPFKKGDPRINRKGPPRKLPHLDTLLADVLGAETNNVTMMQRIIVALAAKAAKGDSRCAEILLDRSYGKLKTAGDLNLTLGQLSDQDIDLLIEKLFNNEQRQNQ